MTASALLSLEGVTKRFGGVTAVNGVSFAVQPGVMHGLIGPNGLGKTTNFNLISGVYRPDAGQITFEGNSIGGTPAYRITRNGIARTFQNLRLFKTMSVLENVLVGLGGSPRGRDCTFPWDPYLRPLRERDAEHRMRAEAMELLSELQIADLADALATSLPYGKQRRVELARALATKPRLLLLDEPAAGLNAEETLKATNRPIIEVHLSNIHARESFRHESLIAPIYVGQVVGLGWRGYLYALEALIELSQAEGTETAPGKRG